MSYSFHSLLQLNNNKLMQIIKANEMNLLMQRMLGAQSIKNEVKRATLKTINHSAINFNAFHSREMGANESN